jgi:DNA-binding response OmpR family regulator
MQFRFGPEDLHQMRILVVEDEMLVAADLAEALAARGAEVIGPVPTLAEAMRAVATHWIDWAVLDVNLAGEMSFELADRLERAGIPYVLATAYCADQLPERFRGKPRLEKPYQLEALAGMIAA